LICSILEASFALLFCLQCKCNHFCLSTSGLLSIGSISLHQS
jgi:hypothetical protein